MEERPDHQITVPRPKAGRGAVGLIDHDVLAVGGDGAIYVGNLSLQTTTSPYKVYKWTNEASTPSVIYSGDAGLGGARLGDDLAAIGSGSSTRLVAGYGSSPAPAGSNGYAIIDPTAKELSFATAGPVRVLAVSPKRYQPLAGPSAALGGQEELRLDELRHEPGPGDLVLVYGTSFLAEPDESVLQALDGRLSVSLQSCLALSAGKLASIAGGILQSYPAAPDADRVLVVMKRRRI